MRVSELRNELLRRGLLVDDDDDNTAADSATPTTTIRRPTTQTPGKTSTTTTTTRKRNHYVALLLNYIRNGTDDDTAATATATAETRPRWIQEDAVTSSSIKPPLDPEQTYRLHSQAIRTTTSASYGTGIGVMVTTKGSSTDPSSRSGSSSSVVVGLACHYLPGLRSAEQASATALALALRWTRRRLGLRHVRWVVDDHKEEEEDNTTGGWRNNVIGTASFFNNSRNHESSLLSPMLYYQIVSLRDEFMEIGSLESVSNNSDGDHDEKCRALSLQALETRETWTWSIDDNNLDEKKNNHNDNVIQGRNILDKVVWMDPMGRDYCLEQSPLEVPVATVDDDAHHPVESQPFNQLVDEFSTEMEPNYAERGMNEEEKFTTRSDQTTPVLNDADENGTAVSGQTTTVRIDPTQMYRLHFDGGSRGNPGPSGAGMVLYDASGEEIWHGAKFLQYGTNNQAEYQAIWAGLQQARRLGIRRIQCCGDSQLIIRQLTGQYKVKSPGLVDLHAATKTVMADFDEVQLKHVVRLENVRADALAQQCMKMGIDSDPQPNVELKEVH